MKKGLAVGGDAFADLVRKNCYYVDKTLFIRTIMESQSKVLLLMRPRRFGKTLFMDTIKSFLQVNFGDPGNSEAQKALFSGLRITEDMTFCDQFMGQCPVISITLKDVEGLTFESAYVHFALILVDIVSSYDFLLNSPRLSDIEKKTLRNYLTPGYLTNLQNFGDCQDFLKNLTAWLAKHFERQVVLLIDDYDAPLASAVQHGYYAEMLELMRSFLGQALKAKANTASDASAYLKKAVLTGCLHEFLLNSNNFDVNTVCMQRGPLASAIGFTDSEVDTLLQYYRLESKKDVVKGWYDGYQIGQTEIYCPWDVIHFCNDILAEDVDLETFIPENYWANTSGNNVIDEFLNFLSEEDADWMQTLIDGGEIELNINEKLTYSDFVHHESRDFWTLLLYSGYLTVVGRVAEKPNWYKVRIPNEEIRDTFEQNVRQHFSRSNKQSAHYGEDLARTILSGDAAGVRKLLLTLLRKYVSVRDSATKSPPENYYQGFLTAILACAGDIVQNFRSNQEAGSGFADIVFTSSDWDTGVVIELKRCAKVSDMRATAQSALEQIRTKDYVQALDDYGCHSGHAFGISFCGKGCFVLSEKLMDRNKKEI